MSKRIELTESARRLIARAALNGVSHYQIAKEWGVSLTTIKQIADGKWRNTEGFHPVNGLDNDPWARLGR